MQSKQEECDFYSSASWDLSSVASLEHLGQNKYNTPRSLPNSYTECCSAVKLCNPFLSLLPKKKDLQPIKERMTKWFLDICRSCLCLKQLSVWCVCTVRAVYAEPGGAWENMQVFSGVTVGKDGKREWCRNAVVLTDCNFTSCGHLQRRLAISLGALSSCLTGKN